jgi:stage II sporulation protein M
MAFKALFANFKDMTKYFVAAALVLTAGIVLGYGYSDRFDTILQSQIAGLRDLAKMIQEKDHSTLWLLGFIFLNNGIKSIFIIAAGVFFGILPIAFLLINGMVIGYLAQMQAETDQLTLFLKGILPHGVLEIPAIVIACAYGIKLGSIMASGLLRAIGVRTKGEFAAELSGFIKLFMPLAALLIGVLFIAAVIEATITPWLIGL